METWRVAIPIAARFVFKGYVSRRQIIAVVASVMASPIVALGVDFVRRRDVWLGTGPAFFLFAAVSLLLGVMLGVGAFRRGALGVIALVLLGLVGATVGMQSFAFSNFHAYADYDALRNAAITPGVFAVFEPVLSTVAMWALVSAALFALPPAIARWRLEVERRRATTAFVLGASLFAATFLVVGYGARDQGAPPDVLLLGALGRMALTRPRATDNVKTTWQLRGLRDRTPQDVPKASPGEGIQRNVLFILTESITADAVCVAPAADCPRDPMTNAATPRRLPFMRMRSVDAATQISFGVMFTGLPVTASASQLLTAPTLFELAHAAGISTAYWSSQDPTFGNAVMWTKGVPIDRVAWGADFDPKANPLVGAPDEAAAERAIADIAGLHEPFFAVLHYNNTHYPYRIDPADAPFQPQSERVSRSNVTALRNRYWDAIHMQDKTTAKVLGAVRSMPFGPRTVVVYISDHGESFYEHDVVLHESSLFDPELRVPAWIDAPEGTLTPDETGVARSLRDVPLTELDVAPTLLDLMHLGDVEPWRPWLRAMAGTSLLRGHPRDRVDAIATCNELWSCFVPAWGLLRGDSKYVFRSPERGFRCFDTRADPGESRDLGEAGCSELALPMRALDDRERKVLLGR